MKKEVSVSDVEDLLLAAMPEEGRGGVLTFRTGRHALHQAGIEMDKDRELQLLNRALRSLQERREVTKVRKGQYQRRVPRSG